MVNGSLRTIYLSMYAHISVTLKGDSVITKGFHAKNVLFRVKFCEEIELEI